MTEYIIVVALIAIAAILVTAVFSQNLRALFAASSNELAGSEQTSSATSGAHFMIGAGRRGLANFGSGTMGQ